VQQPNPTRVRLGGFELNLETGELRPVDLTKDTVLLREQPFQILKMLVFRDGKIVTREEIRRRLWPSDTNVNFDQGINAAIRILRRGLGDSAESPQYIETIARRGYRLLVAPETIQSAAGHHAAVRNSPAGENSGPEKILGKKVSHYRVLEIIGGGGMGMVYKAEDLKLGRRVALKFLPEELAGDPTALRRFEREAQTASALNHPNICTIYEIEEYEGQPFIAMELLDGQSLHQRLEAIPSKVLPTSEIFEIATQVCDGLQAAHEKGIIHRDIKPANIFLTPSGQVKILDFGLAKLIESEDSSQADARFSAQSTANQSAPSGEPALTLAGSAMGTAGYMSPEQVLKEKLDCTTDLYSFGLVLYEVATGHRTFTADTEEQAHAPVLNQSPAPLGDLNPKAPRRLGTIVNKAIEKDRSLRFQSAVEMRRAITKARKEIDSAKSRRKWLLAAASVMVVLLTGLWAHRAFHPPFKMADGDSIVLAVENKTQDLVFDDAIYSGLFFDLSQTPFFNVIGLAKTHSALTALQLPGNSRNSPQISLKVCRQTRSRLMLTAAITQEGNGFHIDEEGVDCQTGIVAARSAEDATSRSEVIHALGLATHTMRGKLGEPKPSLAKFNAPLDLAMSSSPEAIQLLSEGYVKFAASDVEGAADDFQRALDLDPTFVMALAAIGAANNSIGRTSASIAELTRAFELRARAAAPVRMNVEDLYYSMVTGELEKDEALLLQWVHDFPADYFAHNNLSRCMWLLGQQDRSLAEMRDATRLLPSPFAYYNLVYREIRANRFDDARATLREAESRGFDDGNFHVSHADLAFLEGDQAELDRQWQWSQSQHGTDYRVLHVRGAIEGYYGTNRISRNDVVGAARLARQEGDSKAALSYLNNLALQEAETGDKLQAQKILSESSSMPPQRFTAVFRALAFARAGNTSEALRLLDGIERDFPHDTLVQRYSLPAIHAAIDLEQQNGARAVQDLRNTVPYDLAIPSSFADMYPVYLRGLAYLQLNQGQLAEAEFQELIDRSGMVGPDVIGALAKLQIARAQMMAGSRSEARSSYEAFLKLWKDADPDLPIYRQAKTEYARFARAAAKNRAESAPSKSN
jgi:serine/threonine protein kinase/tetratricopeptide (TPR) repeat protein